MDELFCMLFYLFLSSILSLSSCFLSLLPSYFLLFMFRFILLSIRSIFEISQQDFLFKLPFLIFANFVFKNFILFAFLPFVTLLIHYFEELSTLLAYFQKIICAKYFLREIKIGCLGFKEHVSFYFLKFFKIEIIYFPKF